MNNKRLDLMIRFIDIALLIIAFVLLFSFYYAYKDAEAFVKFSGKLPNNPQTDNVKTVMGSVSYFNLFKVVISRVFYGALLLYLRKIIVSIKQGVLFKEELVSRFRKLAIYALYFAGFLLFFNLIFMLAALNRNNYAAFRHAILFIIGIFENYVLTALIISGIAEVFAWGRKMKEEQEFTI